jgi:hypothetical protein
MGQRALDRAHVATPSRQWRKPKLEAQQGSNPQCGGSTAAKQRSIPSSFPLHSCGFLRQRGHNRIKPGVPVPRIREELGEEVVSDEIDRQFHAAKFLVRKGFFVKMLGGLRKLNRKLFICPKTISGKENTTPERASKKIINDFKCICGIAVLIGIDLNPANATRRLRNAYRIADIFYSRTWVS